MSDPAAPTVRLKKGREKSVVRHHPWIFSGAVARLDGEPGPGDVVRVASSDGAFVAWGYFNAESQLQVRVLDRDPSTVIDEEWWRRRLDLAIQRRARLPGLEATDMFRLVHAEADGLPGLIVDRYGDFLVVQSLTAGIERVKPLLWEYLGGLCKPRGIYERSDSDVRRMEGLSPAAGPVAGERPPKTIEAQEGGLKFLVDVESGHKTGFYLDQRDSRRAVARYAGGRSVLDLFSYSGGFGLCALSAGAHSVTMVDTSADALGLARQNAELNGLAVDKIEFVEDNAFDLVRSYRDAARRYDLIIVDPPKFAQTRAQASKAERAYKDINLVAMKLLSPGGILATFSCSGAVGADNFSRVIAWASLDAGRDLQIIERLSQGCDHPVNPLFPESQYLTGLLCAVA